MATIGPKRADGTYRARYRDRAGKEHARHFRRRVDAQRWLDETTTSLVTGAYVAPGAGRITFASMPRRGGPSRSTARARSSRSRVRCGDGCTR